MELDFKINNRNATVRLIEKIGSKLKIQVDEQIYDIDFAEVIDGIYSVLLDNRSYNLELTRLEGGKDYLANTYLTTYDVKVIDAQTRYLQNRNKNQEQDGSKSIISPMPGKIVKILVEEGDFLKAGQTAIIVEAMKMQSDYKVVHDCHVKKILVAEGQTINSHQTLIILD